MKVLFAVVSHKPDRFIKYSSKLIADGVNELAIIGHSSVVEYIHNVKNERFKTGSAMGNYLLTRHNDCDVYVILHDDVVGSWGEFLVYAINHDYGVAGFAGRTLERKDIIWGTHLKAPQEVQTIDEFIFCFKRKQGWRFDEQFIGFNMFGADLCLQALTGGMKNYVFPGKLQHIEGGQSLHTDAEHYLTEQKKLEAKWKKTFEKIVRT